MDISSTNSYKQSKYCSTSCIEAILIGCVSSSNIRTDNYGGSIENRSRFGLRVVDAIASRVGPKHTAIRISPWSEFQGMRMEDPIPTFSYFVRQLKERQPELAYLHAIEGTEPTDSLDFIRDIWSSDGKGILLSAGGHSRESALRTAEKGDLAVFGRWFISNVSPLNPSSTGNLMY